MTIEQPRLVLSDHSRERLRSLGKQIAPRATSSVRISALAVTLGISPDLVRALQSASGTATVDDWLAIEDRIKALELRLWRDQRQGRQVWMVWDDNGSPHRVTGPLAAHLTAMLGLPKGGRGDPVRYAVISGGWVLARQKRSGVGTVTYEPSHVNAAAAAAAADWIETHGHTDMELAQPNLRFAEERAAQVSALRASAAAALTRDAIVRHGWVVDPLPVGLARHSEAENIIRIVRDCSDPLSALLRAGLSPLLSQFEIVGSDVWARQMRRSPCLDTSATPAPVAGYGDRVFGRLTSDRLKAVAAGGIPVLTRLRGPIFGKEVDFESLAVPVRSQGRSLVLTLAHQYMPA